MSIPSGTTLSENMTILVNRQSGSQADVHSYLIQFNIDTGSVEFSARGSGLYSTNLISRPYLERWYHIAVVRQGELFRGYVDGHEVFSDTGNVGNSRTTEGISVGGWGNGKYLFGEVQEVSIYQDVPTDAQASIVQYMFSGQPTNDSSLGLTGYFPLAYSTNSVDELRNFAPGPVPLGTEFATKQGSVTFEEANEAGEQSAFDARKNGGRDALVPLSGSFSWQQTAFARPTRGIALDFRFGYSSANVSGAYSLINFDPYAIGPIGKGFRHSFETRVLPAQAFSPLGDSDTIGLMSWDGALETWDLDLKTGLYLTRERQYRGEFLKTSTNCQWITPERLVYVFKAPDAGLAVMRGRLTAIRDFNRNSVQILWNETSGVITQVVDSVGGKYTFNYQAGLLANVVFDSWRVDFAYDGSTSRLASKSVTNTSGIYTNVNTTWQFKYGTNGLLASVIDPRGNTNILVQYDQYGRKTNAVDAIGRATRTEYGVPGNRQMRHTDPGGFQWTETYDRKGHILSQQDPLTNTTSYTYDDHGNRTGMSEPLGWTTFFGHDDRANVIAKTNALGEVTLWNFHSFFNKAIQQIAQQPPDANGWTTWTNFYAYDAGGNLTNHSDALGSLVNYTYSTNGLVLTSTDANTNTTGFVYDANGFLIARTNPATNTTLYEVNEVGWKLLETDALGESTSYAYDLNGNLVQTVDPIFREFTRTLDPNGNLLSSPDGKEKLTTYSYDAANQRTNMTDRTGTNKWAYFYTSRGKLDHVTDPLLNSIANTYDAANRLIRVTDPLGNSITDQFDANGNLIAFFDKTGQRWTKTFDRLNRVIAETDPLGDTKQTSYDAGDRIQQIVSPNGFSSLHAYDGRGRLTKWVDQQNFPWLYAYDGTGNITDIEDALHGHYVMTYGVRNERLSERNQDNFEWHYDYDELRRLREQKDPNGTVRSVTYDPVGRIRLVNFSTGRQDSYDDYDANDNLKVVTRRVAGVPTTTGFIYDILDHVTQTTDAFSKTVGYGYDPLGRATSIKYPGGKILTNGYDALGRLTNQVDWAGRQTSYFYDLADRLIGRHYPNGVAQGNAFDSAGRITSLSYSCSAANFNGINIALTYAYDRNGNKVGSSELGTLAWPLPPLSDEASHFTPSGRITNLVDALNPTNNFAYQYDLSGNMTNASGGGKSWALTYDEDNRTTSLRYQTLSGTTNIVNRYDALGCRISKTVGGATNGYVLSLVGGMERVLCDLDGSGNVTAWYVHGPDLCYKVDSTSGLTCYHADAMANIIALTDTSTNLIAQYAYTPYGRKLGSTNVQSQNSNPYLFVGSQGVMEELPGLYFMRARYYSADAGVFLSTDPVKKIGPGWRPGAYAYANGNPLRNADPTGLFAILLGGNGTGTATAGAGVEGSGSIGVIIETRALLRGDIFNAIGLYESGAGGVSAGIKGGVSGGGEVGVAWDGGYGVASYQGTSGYTGGSGGAGATLGLDLNYEPGTFQLTGLSLSFGGGPTAGAEGHTGLSTTFVQSFGQIGNFVSAWTTALGPNGPNANSTPMTIGIPSRGSQLQEGSFRVNTGNSSQGSSVGPSLSGLAPGAGNYAQGVNRLQVGSAASSTPATSSTSTPVLSGGSGGNNAFGRVVNQVVSAANNAGNSITQAVSQITTGVGQAIGNAVTAVGNFFSGFFGGHH